MIKDKTYFSETLFKSILEGVEEKIPIAHQFDVVNNWTMIQYGTQHGKWMPYNIFDIFSTGAIALGSSAARSPPLLQARRGMARRPRSVVRLQPPRCAAPLPGLSTEAESLSSFFTYQSCRLWSDINLSNYTELTGKMAIPGSSSTQPLIILSQQQLKKS